MKSNLLITEKDISSYMQNRHGLGPESTKVLSKIHERLYNEKEKYFERKNYISISKEEEELKVCTF